MTEAEIGARVAMLGIQARRARRRSRYVLVTALLGAVAVPLRWLVGVADDERSRVLHFTVCAAVITVAALGLGAWYHATVRRLRREAADLLRALDLGKGGPPNAMDRPSS